MRFLFLITIICVGCAKAEFVGQRVPGSPKTVAEEDAMVQAVPALSIGGDVLKDGVFKSYFLMPVVSYPNNTRQANFGWLNINMPPAKTTVQSSGEILFR